ncbi:1-phosphatidylinositol 4,5-bisphosphate phosphodiesterase eta-2-like isoform X3 [Acropora millepora]|uniref:1-phosphatidylinositol 4,5-bisphosphate phosphodiesterase eta-2-like isoform X3 n=1 Tax=Acropora millepora TaxID=45264 RepID=UPI001CF4F1E2|nr:1-phosphatidylinositol 4,5-bisphosphate phosphodiesterase eta-2-like isoform X3 [Acropora millepora]
MAEQGPDILSHETRIAKSTFDQWRKYKHRRSEKCAENHKFANVGESIEVMHAGTMVFKLRGLSKKYPRRYFLDQQAANIRWTPSKKGDRAKIPIASIKELREVSTTDAFTQCPEMYVENQCFSIIHGDDFCTLDLVFPTPEEFLHWTVGLRYLLAKKSGRIPAEDEPIRRQTSRDQWLKEIFLLADKSGDAFLSVDEVFALMHKLNVKISNRKLREIFKAADTENQDSEGLLDFNEFINFYKSISTRREIYLLLLKYGNSKEHMTVDELKLFLETEQKMSDVTLEHCRQIIQTYEPVEESKKAGNLGIDGFTGYLLGPEGDIFNSQHSKVNQDMTKPLSHYFIASSHNTYLLGDQLTSNSSMDMYVRVLQSGCRCIELDCWDGKDGEPVIYHGYTMTSKVKFRYVILNINDFAFLNNKYPVILSIENHCSISQQKIMAKLMRDIFKDKLVYEASFDGTDLPSPQSLLGKILIKAKKLPKSLDDGLDEGEVTEEDSADEMEECFKLKNIENAFDKRARERKWSRTLSSMRRLRLNKDEEENDGRGDLSSAIVASIATEQTDDASKPASRLQRSFSATFSTRQPSRAVPSVRKSKSFIEKDKKFKRKGKAKASTNEVDSKKTIKLSRQLSDLVAYTQSSAFKGLDIAENETHWEVISVPESKAYRFVDTKGDQFVKYTRHKLCRIFPAGYRIDSSNPNPQAFWNCGCQMVAVNYQTDGRMMQLYRGKFKSNGNCGYVLKPYVMCGDDSKFDPMTRKEIIGVQRKVCKIRVISGQQLPKPKNSILGDRGEIIDPFVEIEVTGIPADNCKRRTKTVIDNGFNPVWEETITFTLTFPNLAIFRFVVWDEDPVGRDFIGQVTLPFPSIMEGYRHVHLDGNQQASIFVHVLITDYHGQKNA